MPNFEFNTPVIILKSVIFKPLHSQSYTTGLIFKSTIISCHWDFAILSCVDKICQCSVWDQTGFINMKRDAKFIQIYVKSQMWFVDGKILLVLYLTSLMWHTCWSAIKYMQKTIFHSFAFIQYYQQGANRGRGWWGGGHKDGWMHYNLIVMCCCFDPWYEVISSRTM